MTHADNYNYLAISGISIIKVTCSSHIVLGLDGIDLLRPIL